MNQENQTEQDEQEQAQRREFERQQLEARAEQKKAQLADGRNIRGGKAGTKAENSSNIKTTIDKIKKTKKNVKAGLLIVRIILSWGLDIAAWAQLFKERPVLTVFIVVILILLLIALLVGLAFLVTYIYCSSFGKLSWVVSLVTDIPDFCKNFK